MAPLVCPRRVDPNRALEAQVRMAALGWRAQVRGCLLGPVIFNLIRQRQRAARASLTLRGSDREALEAGRLFVHFYTKNAPLGIGREAIRLLQVNGLN